MPNGDAGVVVVGVDVQKTAMPQPDAMVSDPHDGLAAETNGGSDTIGTGAPAVESATPSELVGQPASAVLVEEASAAPVALNKLKPITRRGQASYVWPGVRGPVNLRPLRVRCGFGKVEQVRCRLRPKELGQELHAEAYSEAIGGWLSSFNALSQKEDFYIAIGDKSPMVPPAAKWLKSHGFRFHCYGSLVPKNVQDHNNQEGDIVYMRLSGGRPAPRHHPLDIVVLSPDETQVALCWRKEDNCWSFVTGATKEENLLENGESLLVAAVRICQEFSIQADPDCPPLVVNNWESRSHKQGLTWHHIFVLRATGKGTSIPSESKVSAIRWFPLSDIPEVGLYKLQHGPSKIELVGSSDEANGTELISSWTAFTVWEYKDGRGLECLPA